MPDVGAPREAGGLAGGKPAFPGNILTAPAQPPLRRRHRFPVPSGSRGVSTTCPYKLHQPLPTRPVRSSDSRISSLPPSRWPRRNQGRVQTPSRLGQPIPNAHRFPPSDPHPTPPTRRQTRENKPDELHVLVRLAHRLRPRWLGPPIEPGRGESVLHSPLPAPPASCPGDPRDGRANPHGVDCQSGEHRLTAAPVPRVPSPRGAHVPMLTTEQRRRPHREALSPIDIPRRATRSCVRE